MRRCTHCNTAHWAKSVKSNLLHVQTFHSLDSPPAPDLSRHARPSPDRVLAPSLQGPTNLGVLSKIMH